MTREPQRRPSHAAGHMAQQRPRQRRPRERGVEVSNEDRILTIGAGQGAHVTTRHNASQAAGRARKNAEKRYYERHPEARSGAAGPARSAKNVVLLVVLAVLALCLVFLVGRCATAIVAPGPAEQAQMADEQAAQQEQDQQLDAPEAPVDAAFDQVDVGGTLTYGGDTYELQQQEDGLWGVVCTTAEGGSEVLFKIEGTPTALARRQGTILVPENRNGGWDIVCYVLGGHSAVSYVMGEDGSMVSGSGDVTSFTVDETSAHVGDSTGATTDVSLV